jgi:hypothetical protein
MPHYSVRQNMSNKHARNTHISKRKTNICKKKRQNRVNHKKKHRTDIYINSKFSTSGHIISLA